MATPLFRTALVLGLMSAVGPFAIDMYLPALPAIGAGLGGSVPAMQGTITAYFIAFGLAQMIYGPWADQAGRKLPILVGLAVFLLGSVLCAGAGSVQALTAGRAVQGLGAAAVMVVPRAIVRDLYTGHEATRLMATIMLVISVSPFLAPLAGALTMQAFGWRAIFAVLAAAAALSILLAVLAQPETLPRDRRQPVSARVMLATMAMLLRHRGFMALTLLGAFAIASFFVFIAQASFVYSAAFGLTPTQFSYAFAVNALGFFASSQVAAGLGMRFGARRVMVVASTGFAAATVGLWLLALAGLASLPVTMAGLFLGNAFLGLVIPTAMVMALEDQGEAAGMASSLGGTIQMLAGGVLVAVTAPFFDGTVLPMLSAIALCGALAFVLSRVVAALPPAAPVPAPGHQA